MTSRQGLSSALIKKAGPLLLLPISSPPHAWCSPRKDCIALKLLALGWLLLRVRRSYNIPAESLFCADGSFRNRNWVTLCAGKCFCEWEKEY